MAEFHFVSRRTHKLYKQYRVLPVATGSVSRAAKRDANLPMSRRPDKVVHPKTPMGNTLGLDDRNVRLYIFNLGLGAIAYEYHIREDYPDPKHDQLQHFNSGVKPPGKLKGHYFWNDDSNK
ncbi:MAG: hypothetical protein IPH04_14140 [Saprospirales bacterium]|nr:hypothetical protein [Saprospirales bacterium]